MSDSFKDFLDTITEPIPPPEGIEANFDGPNSNGTAYIVIAVIGILLATFFTAVRIYTKAILTRSLGWDDCEDFPLFYFIFYPPPPRRGGAREFGDFDGDG